MKGKYSWSIMKIGAVVCALILGCIGVFLGASAYLEYLSGTSHNSIPQHFYKMTYPTREIAGLVVRDKADELYESETKFFFDNRTGYDGEMNLTFLWDLVEGFDEDSVTFDHPGVTYEVGEAGDGWRRLTIRCEGMDVSKGLTAKLSYPAATLALRETAPGYYKWNLDEYTKDSVPELDSAMAAFENPYACANWIKQNITYEISTEAPQTAAETFSLRKGDCDDIAILFCYMVERLFPEMAPCVVEGWTERGLYHTNVAVRTDEGWLMLDPSLSSTELGVFDFKPFVPSGRASVPFRVTTADGDAVKNNGVGISFGAGAVRGVLR